MEVGLINTLVLVYDSMYHCFTFPDYHLIPTLEDNSYLVDLSISNQIPFFGLEEDLKPLDIAKALHLKKSEIEAHMTSKSGIRGIPAKFLIGKAHYFDGMRSMGTFEAIFALLIYGLVLFPNVDNFIDINAINIFLIGNPVPTLLGDTYYSIDHKTSKSGGMIICCTPLFCGEFPNVHLIGTKGGINYNQVLARCQFGYAMRGKPNKNWLSSFYLKENEDNRAFKEKIVLAWYNIRRKGR
ncbi:uncharacterized protein LOC127103380 [Lathyrus oleraceus]|uniref:uncharacterized protein LOC127103380 n=1 Tax=Pisum sativum TaxID=3888 RepID=UPI0021D2A572|nr:uncharacterized protein LOC127103380 [Pisum sativum]